MNAGSNDRSFLNQQKNNDMTDKVRKRTADELFGQDGISFWPKVPKEQHKKLFSFHVFKVG